MFNTNMSLGKHLCSVYSHEFDEKTYIIMERLLNLFMSRFEVKGLSDEFVDMCGHRNLWELFLFFAPAVAWFKDPEKGVMCLPASGTWKFNSMGKPTEWEGIAINGSFRIPLNDKNSVLMFNDQTLSIPYLQLLYESRFMRKLDMAMVQNIDLQSTPYIIEAYDENTKTASTWSSLLSQFKSRIVLRKKRDKGDRNDLLNSQVLNTNVDLKIKEFMTAYNEFLFRAHTYLGIKNVNIEKSERLLTGEVSANDILIQSNYTNSLNARKEAFDQVNRMFGTNITIEPTDLKSMVADIHSMYMAQGIQQKQPKGGVEDAVKSPSA